MIKQHISTTDPSATSRLTLTGNTITLFLPYSRVSREFWCSDSTYSLATDVDDVDLNELELPSSELAFKLRLKLNIGRRLLGGVGLPELIRCRCTSSSAGGSE